MSTRGGRNAAGRAFPLTHSWVDWTGKEPSVGNHGFGPESRESTFGGPSSPKGLGSEKPKNEGGGSPP